MTNVNVIEVESAAELYERYVTQTEPQDCHIALDCRDGELKAEANPMIGRRDTF